MRSARLVDEWSFEEWEFVGRDEEVRDKGEWSEDNQEGIGQDRYYPMMNYAYPLHDCPTTQTIFKIHEKTNLTVVREEATGECFLALTGAGMDFSQDIAMAYIIAENRVPLDLAREVCVECPLTQHGEAYEKVLRECKSMLEGVEYQTKKIDKSLKAIEGE